MYRKYNTISSMYKFVETHVDQINYVQVEINEFGRVLQSYIERISIPRLGKMAHKTRYMCRIPAIK